MFELNFNKNKDVLCIDIGIKDTKFVVGTQQGKNVLIKKAFTVETPSECYNDGNLVDIDKLKLCFSQCLEKEEIKVKRVNCTSNSTAIITREVIVPSAEEKELDAIVRFEIEQYLPIDLEDYIINYTLMEKVKEETIDKLKMLVVAYPKHMAEQYLMLMQNMNLKPEALDINSNAMAKLFKFAAEINEKKVHEDETVAVIDMGCGHLNIDVIKNGKNDFSRIITSGGRTIDLEIVNYLRVPYKEAEEKKLEEINLSEAGELNLHSVNNIAKDIIDGWIQEINRILQYYKNKKTGNKIDRIYIHGGSSKLRGIENYMSINLGVPVAAIKYLSNIKLDKGLLEVDITTYLNAVGAIIRL